MEEKSSEELKAWQSKVARGFRTPMPGDSVEWRAALTPDKVASLLDDVMRSAPDFYEWWLERERAEDAVEAAGVLIDAMRQKYLPHESNGLKLPQSITHTIFVMRGIVIDQVLKERGGAG